MNTQNYPLYKLMQEMPKVETKYTIAAFIDLLGFSSHLTLANNDTRTLIGSMAIKRLDNLNKILEILKSEEENIPICYPKVEVHRMRFNDAIFLTMELGNFVQTEIGKNTWDGLQMENLQKWLNDNKLQNVNPLSKATDEIVDECHNVSKFVGLVARMHATINYLEHADNFPGARTVICTGLKVNSDKMGIDAFSANFAISNAFVTGESGKASGFGGNKFYLEESVANIMYINKTHHNLIKLSGILYRTEHPDPFDYENDSNEKNDLNLKKRTYNFSNIITKELFGKTYNFRELNVKPLTWIPIRHYIEEELKIENIKEDLTKNTLNRLEKKLPELEKLNSTPINELPFLYRNILLQEGIIQKTFK